MTPQSKNAEKVLEVEEDTSRPASTEPNAVDASDTSEGASSLPELSDLISKQYTTSRSTAESQLQALQTAGPLERDRAAFSKQLTMLKQTLLGLPNSIESSNGDLITQHLTRVQACHTFEELAEIAREMIRALDWRIAGVSIKSDGGRLATELNRFVNELAQPMVELVQESLEGLRAEHDNLRQQGEAKKLEANAFFCQEFKAVEGALDISAEDDPTQFPSRLQTVLEAIQSLKRLLTAASQDLETARTGLTELSTERDGLKAEVSTLTNDKEAISVELDTLKCTEKRQAERIAELERELRQAKEAEDDANTRFQQVTAENQALATDLASVKATLQSTKAQHQKQCDALQANCDESARAVAEMRTRLSTIEFASTPNTLFLPASMGMLPGLQLRKEQEHGSSLTTTADSSRQSGDLAKKYR